MYYQFNIINLKFNIVIQQLLIYFQFHILKKTLLHVDLKY